MDADAWCPASKLVPCKQVASAGGKKQGIQFEQLVSTHKMLCTAIFSVNAEHCSGGGRAAVYSAEGRVWVECLWRIADRQAKHTVEGSSSKHRLLLFFKNILKSVEGEGGSTEASHGLRKPKNVMSAACSSVPLHWVPPWGCCQNNLKANGQWR